MPAMKDPVGFAVRLLVIVTAVPAAVIVLPNTAAYVMPQAIRDLGLGEGHASGFVRVFGLALPALLLATAPAAAAVRRLPVWTVLFTGLAVMLVAQAVAGHVGSLPLVGVIRVAEGAGAGLVLPATLALAWERHRSVLTGIWAGVFTAALVAATPLALSATPAPGPDHTAWRVILHPHWRAGAVALVGAGLLGLAATRRVTVPSPREERVRLLLPVVPAAGFAFLAVVTTYDRAPGAQFVLAVSGVVGLLGLALVGSRDAITGSPLGHAVVMLGAGLLTMPVTGPLAGLLGGRAVAITPFAACAACAAAGAVAAAGFRRAAGRGVVLFGQALGIVAILLLLAMGAQADRWDPLFALCVLGAGVGIAAGAAIRPSGPGPALFGLSLCFPAVLAGNLVVGAFQVAEIGSGKRSGTDALTAAYRLWLLIACALVVVLAVVTAWAGRRGRGRRRAAADADGAALQAR